MNMALKDVDKDASNDRQPVRCQSTRKHLAHCSTRVLRALFLAVTSGRLATPVCIDEDVSVSFVEKGGLYIFRIVKIW